MDFWQLAYHLLNYRDQIPSLCTYRQGYSPVDSKVLGPLVEGSFMLLLKSTTSYAGIG